eukprot:SAG31_NODE_2946_length_4874_cov_1.638534_8_plen_75_part_00
MDIDCGALMPLSVVHATGCSIEFLLENGASLDATDARGHDALFCALMNAHGGIGVIPCRHIAGTMGTWIDFCCT